MHRRLIILFVVLGLVLPGLLVSLAADETGAPLPTGADGGTSLMMMSDAQAENLSPLNREIRTLLLQERTDVARLATQLKTIQDPVAALAVQRRISALKSGTQISILEVQGRFARQEGRIEQADEIDAIVVRMKDRQEARLSKQASQ